MNTNAKSTPGVEKKAAARSWLRWALFIIVSTSILAIATVQALKDVPRHGRSLGEMRLDEVGLMLLTAGALFAVPEVAEAFRRILGWFGKLSRVVVSVVYALPGVAIVLALGAAARKAHWKFVADSIGVSILLVIVGVGLICMGFVFANWASDEGWTIRLLSDHEKRKAISLVFAVFGIGAGAALQWVAPFVG